MDLNMLKEFKESIETRVYPIQSDTVVPLHLHDGQDEVFYCIKGSGYGILADSEVELKPGDTFVARAGELHSVRTDGELLLTAFLVPNNRIICRCKQVRYGDIRKAMTEGARTIEDIQEATGAGTGCGGCIKEIERIVKVACGCKNVSIDMVVEAVNAGADTVEKVEEVTGAGAECGKCKMLLQNIVDTKR